MLNPPFRTYCGKSPHTDSPLKMKKTPTPLKIFFENQKVPPIGWEDTIME